LDAAGGADRAQLVALRHLLAHLDVGRAQVGVGRDPAVGVLDQHEVAEGGHLIAGIGHLAVGGGHDRRALRRADVQAVVALARALDAEVRDDLAAQRPGELAAPEAMISASVGGGAALDDRTRGRGGGVVGWAATGPVGRG
jgi:hypothetical protein